MSYRVLARTYRSNTFDELVGQDAITTTLKNAIASGRVHHGYLFTGTRGVGKTSLARILAKALNCLEVEEPTATPCCKCESCLAVAEGEDVDVVEIDAASNTGVDNIRELRSNATLRPARARHKIYIIDEVHMLSAGAFNALLKTLEEPPPHVKFILATTEAQKVPATIKSRCQRFDFRAIDTAAIASHLSRLADAEKIQADEDVLRRIARLARGSMRDALSLLDKVLSYEPEHLTAAVLDEVIPPPHDELAAAVMACVAEGDAAGALRAVDQALQSGRTVERFCGHLIEHVRTLMLMRVCGPQTELVDVAGQMRAPLAEQADHFDAPTYVYMITLLEELRRNVKFSGAARALADAAVVRLAMSRQFTDINELIARLESEGGPFETPPKTTEQKKNAGGERTLGGSPSAMTTTPGVVSVPGTGTTSPSGPAARIGPSSSEQRRAASDAAFTGKEGPPGRVLSSATREKVARDPAVRRVQDAVDGTLLNVWRVRRADPAPPNDGEQREPQDDETDSSDME